MLGYFFFNFFVWERQGFFFLPCLENPGPLFPSMKKNQGLSLLFLENMFDFS